MHSFQFAIEAFARARMCAFMPVFAICTHDRVEISEKSWLQMSRNLWSFLGEIKQKLPRCGSKMFTGFDGDTTHGRAKSRIGIPYLINHRYICANTTTHSQGSRHFRIPIFIARHEPHLVIDLPRILFRTEMYIGIHINWQINNV